MGRLVLLALVALTLGLAARAQSVVCDDPAMDEAIEHQQHGHPIQAEAVLRRLAEAGDVVAMERLALMHWYGEMLFGAGPWQRELARHWFARAAVQGSELGLHMGARAP
jgi:TPR repeat protein